MRTIDLIAKKRDGGEHTPAEIGFLIEGATRGTIPDYQLSAWLMAVVCRGMTRAETAALTEAMLRSGKVLDLSALAGAKVDKHSTGGVGDKTSLVVAPIAVASGLRVPMISGRGLGHTGGTLDKLEAIPGFRVELSLEEFRSIVASVGCAFAGQTPEIAPADKRLYALRDVTATVPSPALICASIMSKKLAEGIDALVLDVKMGDGAFMKKEDDARHLAELMVETGARMGKRVTALITDMEQPLGQRVGNALEVEECIEVLHDRGPEDLRELCFALAAWMLLLGGAARTSEEAQVRAREIVARGRARDTFREAIRAQGGDARVVDDPARLPRARATAKILSRGDGWVTRIWCEQVGVAGVMLGAGREKKEDGVDPAVGIVVEKKVGEPVKRGEMLATIHYNSAASLEAAKRLLEEAFVVGPQPPERRALVRGVIESRAS